MKDIQLEIKLSNLNKLNLLKLKNTVKQEREYLRTKTENATVKNQIRLNNQKTLLSSQIIPKSERNTNIRARTKSEFQNKDISRRHKRLLSEISCPGIKEINERTFKPTDSWVYEKDENVKKQKYLNGPINRYPTLHNNSSNNLLQLERKGERKYRSYKTIQHKQKKYSILQKTRAKSQQNEKIKKKERLEKVKKFSQNIFKNTFRIYEQNKAKYKNEKLDILAQEHMNIIKKMPEHMIDPKKFQADMLILLEIFSSIASKKFELNRHDSHRCRTFTAKLIFFIGYEIYMRFRQDCDEEYQNYQLIVCNYYQIYFAMRLKAPLIVMQSYQQLIDIAIKANNYVNAQKFAEKCLLASIYYKQKYYQERCIQKISMCQYYKGNICQATYLHDNNGQVTQQSLRKIRDSYNQQEELDLVSYHLYEVPRFQVEEILNDYEKRMDSYKLFVVFKSPRIEPQQSMESKKQQLKHDIRAMERIKDFKNQANIMRKQINKRQDLFTVKKVTKQAEEFQLVKRNLTINTENQSSQILRVHQSFNRLKKINNNPLKMKMCEEFVQFLQKIISKLH